MQKVLQWIGEALQWLWEALKRLWGKFHVGFSLLDPMGGPFELSGALLFYHYGEWELRILLGRCYWRLSYG